MSWFFYSLCRQIPGRDDALAIPTREVSLLQQQRVVRVPGSELRALSHHYHTLMRSDGGSGDVKVDDDIRPLRLVGEIGESQAGAVTRDLLLQRQSGGGGSGRVLLL